MKVCKISFVFRNAVEAYFVNTKKYQFGLCLSVEIVFIRTGNICHLDLVRHGKKLFLNQKIRGKC